MKSTQSNKSSRLRRATKTTKKSTSTKPTQLVQPIRLVTIYSSPIRLAINRFLKIVVPQAVLFIPYLIAETNGKNVPAWVAPTLVFLGAIVTAFDKYLREIGVYEETPIDKLMFPKNHERA